MRLRQEVKIISKILKTVRDDYIFRASPSEMIYSFKNMPNLKNYFVWWEDPGRAFNSPKTRRFNYTESCSEND